MNTAIEELYKIILNRVDFEDENSYTKKLLTSDVKEVAKKIGEEGVEVAISMVQNDKNGIIYESTDLIYHLLVGLVKSGIKLDEISEEITKRINKNSKNDRRN